MNTENLHTIVFIKNGLSLRRLISFSKTVYRNTFPTNKVIFNSNIITSEGKSWFGDIDVTRDIKILTAISNEINEPLYILREMDCWDNIEKEEVEEYCKKAIYIVNQQGEILDSPFI